MPERLVGALIELFVQLVKGGAQLLLLFVFVVLGVTVIIRIGVFIKELFIKKTGIPFRTVLNFRKWLEFSMDLFIIGAIVLTLVGEMGHRSGFNEWQGPILFLVTLAIRITLYVAIRAEEKKTLTEKTEKKDTTKKS